MKSGEWTLVLVETFKNTIDHKENRTIGQIKPTFSLEAQLPRLKLFWQLNGITQCIKDLYNAQKSRKKMASELDRLNYQALNISVITRNVCFKCILHLWYKHKLKIKCMVISGYGSANAHINKISKNKYVWICAVTTRNCSTSLYIWYIFAIIIIIWTGNILFI